MVDEGMCYYALMSIVHRISTTLEHHACMVNLLDHSGHLKEAENVIKATCKPNADMWMALLGACRIHGNVEMEEHDGKQLFKLDFENATTYVLLSNIYAAAGKRDLSDNVEQQRKESVW
jgi:hypothetical protein